MIIKQKLNLIYKTAEDKKAKDIKVISVVGLSSVTNYFVICGANSTTQANGIANAIENVLSEKNIEPFGKEGKNVGKWIVLDYVDVMIHILNEDERDFYDLEKVWETGEVMTNFGS